MAIMGDQARVSVKLALSPELSFRAFTEDINQWWRRGLRYRVAAGDRGILSLEPRVGGRLIESFEDSCGLRLVETGQITVWEPPHRLMFNWRAVNFAPDEQTEVEVLFTPSGSGTLVTLTHRGWAHIRPDHPARHGQEVPVFIRTMGLWWSDLLTSLRLYSLKQLEEYQE